MTLREIQLCDKDILTPADVADVLDADPQNIRSQVQVNAASLGFPVCVMGSRVKIPRRSFLKFMGVESEA